MGFGNYCVIYIFFNFFFVGILSISCHDKNACLQSNVLGTLGKFGIYLDSLTGLTRKAVLYSSNL